MVIFISFLEMILPNSNMKRFIDMIVGLLIIVVIITPFIKIISRDIDIEKHFLLSNNKLNSELKNNHINEDEKVSKLQEEQIIKAYEKNIEKEIQNLIEKETDYELESIEITIDNELEAEDYGSIREMSLVLRDKKKKSLKNKKEIQVEKIENVWIKNNKIKKEDKDFEDSNKIKKLIAKEYGLPIDKISTHLIGNGR